MSTRYHCWLSFVGLLLLTGCPGAVTDPENQEAEDVVPQETPAVENEDPPVEPETPVAPTGNQTNVGPQDDQPYDRPGEDQNVVQPGNDNQTSDPADWPRDQQLVGTWVRDDNFWSGDYSSTTSTAVTLFADGTFESRSFFWGGTDGVGGNSDEEVDRGQWAAEDAILRLVYADNTYDDYGYYIEYMAGDLLMLTTDAFGGQSAWTHQ